MPSVYRRLPSATRTARKGGEHRCPITGTATPLIQSTQPNCELDVFQDLDQLAAVDLRTILLESSGGEWYVTTPEGMIDDPLTLEPRQTPLTETDYLPGAGYFLYDESRDVASAIQRALDLGKVVAEAGEVEQVRRSAGEWGLLTEHGVKTGKVAPSGPDLDDWQIGKHYRFKCAEVTEQDALWRDRTTLYQCT